MSTNRSIVLEHETEAAATGATKCGFASPTAQPRYLVPANDGDDGAPAIAVREPVPISAGRIARLFR